MSLTAKEVVRVANICLPVTCHPVTEKNEKGPEFFYKEGSSPYSNIQQLALAVSCNRPVLLQGPVGSGKTCTVEYLAFITGHKLFNYHKQDLKNLPLFLKVQLGEQTDAKVLLGGYQCTEIPGQFSWKPGILTQAVMNGYWLLLEDIDSTSSDVITVIDNLVKMQSLSVPGYSTNIIPHKNFQLFATQRTLRYESTFTVKSIVLKQWITIQLNPLKHSEIIDIIIQKYPRLSTIASRMVSILDLDSAFNSANVRVPTVRDILKWCDRCHSYFETGSTDSALRIFHDAVDIFCGFMEKESSFQVAVQIGIKLGIVKNKAHFLNKSYKPNILISNEKLIAGRVLLKRQSDGVAAINKLKKNYFSLTTQACCLIEKISCCLQNNEPVLLVGETGCGKTTILQFIAQTLGRTLVVINMNQQSDTADLLGGYKPVTFKWVMKPLCEKFEILFRNLFDPEKNVDCLNKFARLLTREKWETLINFISHVHKKAMNQISNKLMECKGKVKNDTSNDKEIFKWKKHLKDWEDLGILIKKFESQRQAAEKSLIFSFVEGSLTTAMKKGYWVLLDEINLANSETLDCLSGLLENSRGSISLIEKGENKPIFRNSGFRLFAAMNPATDVGKKQLPIGLRNRFTELYIDELDDQNDLLPLVETYLCELNLNTNKLKKIIKFYLKVKKISKTELCDGHGRKPHYSLRNLCRALMISAKNVCGHATKSLYEGLSVSFLTQLDSKSYKIVHDLIVEAVTETDIKAILNQPIPRPRDNNHVNLEGFWLPVGSLEPTTPDNYILTKTVRRHFRDLIKIVSLGSGIPVLLEGDTSVGKTSLINYLAKCTGNICDRVNNHEHTDIQEYIGTYVADSQGKLVFKEGILCEAMRKGHWLILDELNLAPTEVLEALNRVLDDNREIFIPETQKTIKAHDKFLLFATQNPPGLYGGRKELSRAFRNRFIQLQFNQIPADELVTILEKRCQLPLKYSKKMVNVMTELQLRRRGSDLFIGKSGYITLRDLFRWGERYKAADIKTKFYDWEQHLADEGFILLGGRVRLQEESLVIQEVIKKYFNRITNTDNLFSLHENTSNITRKILEQLMHHSQSDKEFQQIVWTYSMRRLAVLVCKALDFSEPVLIVGETGCGKTSVVQLIAKIKNQELYSINCHMHSESADFLGGLRPVRSEARAEGKLFEWCDGPLIQAMNTGSFFLADEISLADDSVLERLNSLLEPERTILLVEKGGGLLENDEEYVTVANKNFQFIGTMNPGGDYGKKELSPALRNRFTEIWAETFNKFECFFEVMKHNLKLPAENRTEVAHFMTSFLKWFCDTDFGKKMVISIRDVLTWVNFMNLSDLEWYESCIHGVNLAFLDGLKLSSGYLAGSNTIKEFKKQCAGFLANEISKITPKLKFEVEHFAENVGEISVDDKQIGIHPFFVKKGNWPTHQEKFIFNAPTTFSNAKRIFRGLIMNKAILLEGSPGVGKTSLVSSLANLAGYKLTRINLSDQTDISDLFGSDLPEEGGSAGHFIWRDGPFLTALKEGHWILLDELNLASQSVLEGLNAVLDHRGSVYIPQLNKTFYISTGTRLFGCQNPFKEGGNRRGLPKSFLNRFIKVYVDSLTKDDYIIILKNTFPLLAALKINGNLILESMIDFNEKICQEIAESNLGIRGGPWELNLRDITRWAEGFLRDISSDRKKIIKKFDSNDEENILKHSLIKYMNLLYKNRFPHKKDREKIYEIFVSYFGDSDFFNEKPQFFSFPNFFVLGENVLEVNDSFFYGDVNEFEMFVNPDNFNKSKRSSDKSEILKICSAYRGKQKMEELRLLEKQFPVLCSLSQCINMNWFVILVGETGVGKTNCVRTLATLKGENLRVMTCNSAMDTTEILGGFEQTDFNRHLDSISETGKIVILSAARRYVKEGKEETCLRLLKNWIEFKELLPVNDDDSMSSSFEALKIRLDFLVKILEKEEVRRDKDLKKLSDDLIFQLQSLKMQISSADCLTLGGKFEWVDSLLVKSLKDGSWLLIEDVNLCSNAVLDRLNCLFEPNGSLTLGERGGGPDGQMFTITPHPNFRCFFTMDPRNGSISRAMRNRGVEIYMPNEELNSWPFLDLLSLLNDVGVNNMEIHKALMKVELNNEEQNICNLISNGFWMAQYVKHGFPAAEAFKKSCEHVYKFKDPAKVETVEELSIGLDKANQKYCSLLARPRLNTFLMDPAYARLQQTAAVIYLSSEIIRNRDFNACFPKDVLEYFFGMSSNHDAPIVDIVKYNILHIFLTISKEFIIPFANYLEKLLSNPKDRILKTIITSTIERIRCCALKTDTGCFAWDQRWFLNIEQVFGQQCKNVNANKILLLIKYLFSFNSEEIPVTKEVSVKQYSNYVQEGRMEDVFYNQPIVSKFNKYLKEFDDLIEDTLSSDAVIVTEEEAIWFLNIMKWRFRLGSQGNLVLLSGKKKTVNEDTLTLLELHLFWFLDFIVFRRKQTSLSAFETLSDSLRQRYTKYYQTSLEIKSLENSSKLIKMCNTFRKHLGHPSPKKYTLSVNGYESMEETTDMAVDTDSFFQGDLIILQKILNTLSIYFDVKLRSAEVETSLGFAQHVTKYLSLLNRLGKKMVVASTFSSLISEFLTTSSKEREKMMSEMTYFFLKVINSDYAFEDEINETTENLYTLQVLPFHRPVLTSRVLTSIFDVKDEWSLSKFRKSQNELADVLKTILPNAVQLCDGKTTVPLLDLNKNEWHRINLEVDRVLNCLKKCLGIESDEEILKGIPMELMEKSSVGVEKIFYTRLDTILKILVSFKGKEHSDFQGVGCYWTVLGLLELLILREGKLDPIRKKLIKADYAAQEVNELETEILALQMYSVITGANQNHFYVKNLRKELEKSSEKVEGYKNYKNLERNPKSFREFCQEVESYMTAFDEIFRFVGTVWEKIFLNNDVSIVQHFYRKGRFIILRTKKFSQMLESKFATHFGDLVYPVLAVSAQIEHGINIIMSELLRYPYHKNSEVESLISDMCSYPITSETQLVYRFEALTPSSWPRESLKSIENNKILILFSTCLEKYNEWIFSKNSNTYNELMGIFSLIVQFWKEEEEKKLKEKMEKESLYRHKASEKCDITPEETEFLEDQMKLFPTYEEDFGDGGAEGTQKNMLQLSALTDEHLFQVSRLHMKVINEFIKTSWYSERNENLSPDLVSPICMRFALLWKMLPSLSFLLNWKIDDKLTPGLLVLINEKLNKTFSPEARLLKEPNGNYDFYQDKNVEEVDKCLEILNSLNEKVKVFLSEWPEHPALIQINTIAERILTFSIESPVIRFLNGLELVLQSCQRWESVAHSGISIADDLVKITNLIIEWRRLELQGWKNCLEAASERIKKSTFKWWFHFWCVINQYLTEEGPNASERLDELLVTLYNFIETSPVGEFDARLEILFSYHFHVCRLPPSTKRDVLAISLWNLHAFYQQFKGEVAKKLSEDSAPIFKKLKEYVKIAKWQDITYWSVKQAIEKSHRTLMKFIKEYEVLLKQKVDLKSLNPLKKDGSEKKKKNQIQININKFLTRPENGTQILLRTNEVSTLKNLDKKLGKMKKFCNEIVLRAEYPNLILSLEDLSKNICENTEHFASLDVDRSLPLEKQKSQAKNIVQLKRRGLADLFKTLQQIGLSYRVGLSSKTFGVLDICDDPPMNYEEKERLSGESYYFKTTFRRIVLENSLLTPSKEIGPQVIERLRGYSSHIMALNKKQKITLNEGKNMLDQLLHLQFTLESLIKSSDCAIPNQKLFFDKVEKFSSSINQTYYLLEQFGEILESWPLSGSDKMKEMNFVADAFTPSILVSSKADDFYVNIRKKYKEICLKILHLKNQLQKKLPLDLSFYVKYSEGDKEIRTNSFRFFTFENVLILNELVKEYKDLGIVLDEFLENWDCNNVKCNLIGSLHQVKKWTNSVEFYPLRDGNQNAEVTEKNVDFFTSFNGDVETLIENILIGIQRLTKKYKRNQEEEEDNLKNQSNEESMEDVEEHYGDLLDNHFDKKLTESLRSDIEDLNIKIINEKVSSLFRNLTSQANSNVLVNISKKYFRLLSTTLEFLKQYSLLCSYFIAQQSLCYRSSNKLASILLGTFIQVAQKGYCAPPEYEDDESGKGDGWNDGEGGGFTGGDGEGQKDVSDRIESEDQLEDARPMGSEKDKDDGDKDCKEEEKGIEMSENFDGKAQDLDEDDENESKSENEDEEEPDMEMGNTEEGVDKLESEMWSESDEEDEEKNADKKEEKGRGEQISKDEYGAKSDNDDDDGEGDNSDGKEKKEKKKEINEMEESEDNGDQIDPYHGNHPPEPEPEPLDLPEDMQLDEGETKGDANEEEEDPFNIDSMKEKQPPLEMEEDEKKENQNQNENDKSDDSEEEDNPEGLKDEEMEVDEQDEIDEDVAENSEKENENRRTEKNDEEDLEKVDENNQEEFHPSDDKPSVMPAQPAPDTNAQEPVSSDQVMGNEDKKPNAAQPQETSQYSDIEPKGTGQAEIEQMKQGHDSSASKKEKLNVGQSLMEKQRKRERPGKSDDDRCLGEAESVVNKKLKTLDKLKEEEAEEDSKGKQDEESEIYQHVSEKVENASQVLDAATKEQAESQPVPNKENEEGDQPEEENVAMDVDEEEVKVEDVEKRKPSEMDTAKNSGRKTEEEGDLLSEEVRKQIEGEVVQTMTAERAPETTFHTVLPAMADQSAPPLRPEEIQALRLEINQQLLNLNKGKISSYKQAEAWQLLTSVVDGLARDLSEQLRLILEPTQATRLKGDYRTGKRINMRKVISYIASEFRKDRIWLRRTKPWKRDHEIVLAIDDSSSMSDNESKELAFESLALVFKALGFIEAGQLGVLSFGEKTKIVHRLGDPFTDENGLRLLEEITFEQKQTLVSEMLTVSTSMMMSEKKKGDVARLLLIVSDGRGVFAEGLETVKAAVRRATDCGIFVVFLIIDNPKSKDSIMDIRVPEFKDGKLVGLQPYMELFPFPFYLILRDISALPNTLSDALRQWFELTTANST